MKSISLAVLTALLLPVALAGAAPDKATAEPAPLMTVEELRAVLESPDLTVIDVRVEDQWKFSNRKIPGAVHENPEVVLNWVEKYPKGNTIVFY